MSDGDKLPRVDAASKGAQGDGWVGGACRVGIDIGGTFTDLVMMDERSGAWRLVKLASTPADPSVAFLRVAERAYRESSASPTDTRYLVHATTVATNTIIEGRGARAALIATAGFRDVLEIARQIRPQLYNLFCDKPRPLIPRHLCFEVPERVLADGSVAQSLDEPAVRGLADVLREQRIEAVAVCLLHAYRRPDHERRIREILTDAIPGVPISLSSDLCPEMREYYRASTTCINALVAPVVGRYLERLESRLDQLGVPVPLHLMTSAGGMISSDVARAEPVQLIESGPAAGVIAATHVARQVGIENLISFDMGGTTAKLGLVENGAPRVAPHFEVGSTAVADDRGAGYPVRTPVIDLVEIGAGGGSIAWIDPGGALRVGPRSGGADPGPACYGLGATEPGITDANLLLGRLNPDYFIGGEQRLQTELSAQAVSRLADQLGLGLLATAHGIVEIANANMLAAIRLVSVQKGLDPREFVLVAFGGAGPVHANGLAHLAGIPRVLIPRSPGVMSAYGLLVSDLRHDFQQTLLQPLAAADWSAIDRTLDELGQRAQATLTAEHVPAECQTIERAADMRYVGQSFELTIPLPDGPINANSAESLRQHFYAAHHRTYGYATEDAETELVTLRVVGHGQVPRPAQFEVPAAIHPVDVAVKMHRDVYFDELGGLVATPIYDRYRLQAGHVMAGPAVVEEVDSTTVVHPGYLATVDRWGNLTIAHT